MQAPVHQRCLTLQPSPVGNKQPHKPENFSKMEGSNPKQYLRPCWRDSISAGRAGLKLGRNKLIGINQLGTRPVPQGRAP